MEKFNGKALYQPSGKAAEYSPWAANFYTGCSNDCEYCYCKRGVLSHVWDTKPNLKKCFRDEDHALNIFTSELSRNLEAVRKTGVLFSFTTDPMLPETRDLTMRAAETALEMDVPVQILTKRADWFYETDFVTYVETSEIWKNNKHRVAFGFTLTGFDEMEPFADLNGDRVVVLIRLKYLGFRTFASIEPVVTPSRSMEVIDSILGFCDLFKVGLMSGKKTDYNPRHMHKFMDELVSLSLIGNKIYLKDSFLDYFELDRAELPGKFVDSDYDIFAPDADIFKSQIL